MEVNGAHEEPSVTDGQLRGEGGAGTSPSARGEVPAASAGGTAAEDGISGPHTARPTEPPPPPPRPPPEAEAAVKSEPREEETESPRPRGEVTVKQDTSSTNVVSRLQTANTEQVLQGIEAWVGMWTVAKYKVKYGAGLVGGRAGGWWQGWWLARLRNRKNSVGSLVNLMLEVTTNVPQDSPPQDFSEIYVLNTSSASSALDSIRLLTPLLGEIRNKSSRHLALRELQVKCGMFQIDPEPDGVRAPGDDVGLREDAPKEAFFDTGEPAAKRQKIGESLRTKQSSAEGGAGGTGRSGRERKAVRRLDPAEAMAKDRDALEKHKRASGCEGRRGGRCGRGQKGSASQYAPVVAPVPDDEAQWRREGNGYIGKRVRRSLWSNGDEPVVIGTADARIVGWLPKEESDFLDEAGQPAPLWHIVYENTQIGEEDLEEYEVKESLELFERGMPARDLPPNPATHAARHAGHTAHPAVSSELSGHPPARSQATHAPERAATVRQAGANAAAPPPHSAAPIRAPGAQPPANNVPTEAHTVQALHAVAPASRSAEPAPQGQAAVAQVDAATGSPQARLHSVDSAYSVSCVAVAPALSETAMRGVGSASAPSRAPPLHTGSGGAEATQKAAAAAGAGAGGAGWAPAVAVATVVGVPGGGSAAQTSQGAPRVPTVSLDAARLTFSPVSAAAYGASGFFLPPCRSQDLTIFQLFCVVGVPFTIGARTLFPESYTAPPTLSWAQEYLRVDSRFQQSCEYAFDPFTNTLKGKFAIDGEFRVELLVKLTVGPSTVVGVDVYKCILNFTVKPQLAFTNYPPAIPVMISPCKPEYIALLPASHLPYSSFSCLEISDGHAVGAEQVGSWVQVDGQTGTISITLPRRFQAMQPLGHASTQRTLCFTIRCWNLMGWQQCQLTLELHSLPPPPEPALPPTIGAGTPAGALVPFVRPNEVKMVASAVCTPVHASNGGAGVNEKGAVAGVLAAHGCPGAGRAGAHATPAASAAVLAMQTAAGASPCHAMAARATGMATAARTAVSVGFGGNKGIGLPVPVVARASIVSADDKDLAVNAVAVPLDA